MALKTLGTAATTTLPAFVVNANDFITADIATLKTSIKDDQTNGNPIWPGSYERQGLLFIPNRGVLKCLPGDYIGVDASGWPILLSALAAANANWVHT